MHIPVVQSTRNRLVTQAVYAAVALALVLITIKTVAWLATGSVSMHATLMDSILDMVASLVTMVAVRSALKPADDEHRFGHGKIEALAALGQSAFIAGSAVLIVFEAFRRFLNPQPIAHTTLGVVTIVVAIILTGLLVLFQNYVARKTGSLVVQSDSIHYRSDLLINISVLLSLLLSHVLEFYAVDAFFGACIALYILITAWLVLKKALDVLLDRELPAEDRDRIATIVMAHPKVTGLHDLRTRSTGQQKFIQLHAEMPGDLSLQMSHQIVDDIEAAVRVAYPEAEILIHQDVSRSPKGR